MNVPILTGFLRRRERIRLRHVMRGYRLLQNTNQLGKIAAVKDAIANTQLSRCTTGSAGLFFGAGLETAELVIRQYLLVRLASVNLNTALLRALGEPDSTLVYPLPPEWRQVLRQHGFKIGEVSSALVWTWYVWLHLAYGASGIARRALESIAEMTRPSYPKLGRYAFFHGLSPSNLPAGDNFERSHEILSWYLKWPGRISELQAVAHTVRGARIVGIDGVPVVQVPAFFRPLSRLGQLARYIGWGIGATLTAIADLLRGRWWHGLILNEASFAALMRQQGSDDVARDYLFNNSMWVFRPLWTYEAEKLGSRITYYFYSTNCESFRTSEGYPLQENFWQVMNWPYYLVWDEYQADFVRRAVGPLANISVVGPIWFQSGTPAIPSLPPRSVAVFDVEPHRKSRYQVLGMAQEYFVPGTANRFLVDIHEAVRECGGTMVLKRKRAIGKLLNRSYRSVIDGLSTSDHFVPIDPSTSAQRVVESCAAVISMPFTSTALLAREIGKPSIYYDPVGIVQKGDRAAHGIEIVSGREELRTWLHSALGPAHGIPGNGGYEPILGGSDSIDSGPAQSTNMSTAK